MAGALPRPIIIGTIVAICALCAADTKLSAIKLQSIAGVSVGMDLERARDVLKPLGTGGSGEEEAEERGSVKEAWSLKSGDFKTLAYKADEKGHIKWVTGWVRPGKEIPFSSIGDLKHAARSQESQAIWNVSGPSGDFRIVARGIGAHASVITFMSLGRRED
jgi:hypothetical protein